MRISNSMFQQVALRDLNGRLQSLARAQRQVASGRRILTASDDPIDASQIMRLDSRLRDVEQYRRNAASAATRLSAEDVTLTAARDLVARAKSLALSGASDSPSDPVRQAALAEVRQILEQLVSLGNTRVGSEYIFAGAQTSTPPFLENGRYVGDTVAREVRIDEGLTVEANHTGNQMMSAALQSVVDLATQLQVGSADSIQGSAAGLDAAAQILLGAQTEVGVRLRQVEDTTELLARRAVDLTGRLESLRDADPAESLLKVATAQTALEQAYAAVGRLLSSNILDYLK